MRMNPQRCEIFRNALEDSDWACVSRGVVLIRKMSVRLLKREAERRYRPSGNTTVKIVPPKGATSM